MSSAAVLKFGCTLGGYVARIEGRGTLAESPTFRDLVVLTLADHPTATVTVDLSACDYLDSTLLGCLAGLHRQFGHLQPPRFLVAASNSIREKLLAPTRLDRLFTLIDAAPECVGSWAVVPTATLDDHDAGHHVMECHRRLADLDCPGSSAFASIADQLARELDAKQS